MSGLELVKDSYNYESRDEPNLGEANRLRINFFNITMVTDITPSGESFQQLCDCSDIFSIIFAIMNLTRTRKL